MNPLLNTLQPYPFAKLRKLLEGAKLPEDLKPISLSIGEPKHPAPDTVKQALFDHQALFEKYPPTGGYPELKEAIGNWIEKRYGVKLDPASQILPTNGSREALFALTQVLIDPTQDPVVVMPNPFYQIYEGATKLAGAQPYFCPMTAETGFKPDYSSIPEDILKRTQLLFVCSPNNPTGTVLSLEDWRKLFDLSDKYGFVIGSDECYSEIYFDEDNPPLGALSAAKLLGRPNFDRLIVFSSLSKRSNIPGMRTGFVAGDEKLIKPFLLYRTYHGSAMGGAVQHASIAAWNDEEHVRENRRFYVEKFKAAVPLLKQALEVEMPDASFYLWAKTPIDDKLYARRLYEKKGITVLPGSFLGREVNSVNPGSGYIRIALVATVPEVTEAAQRIAEFDPFEE